MATQVKKIHAYQIFDSRGIPTLRGVLQTNTNLTVVCDIASGAAIGKFELKELRDNTDEFSGKGVKKAAYYINNLIAPKLLNIDITRHFDVDRWLKKADTTKDTSILGVNTIFLVSQLFISAASLSQNKPLCTYIQEMLRKYFKIQSTNKIPSPIINIINGGKHGTPSINFQEFHIIPATSYSYAKSLEIGVSFYQAVSSILEYRNVGTFVSYQGGFSPNLRSNTDVLEVLKEATLRIKKRLGIDVFIGIDCASSNYFKDNKYYLNERAEPYKEDEYIGYLKKIIKDYSILFLEDPFAEDSISSWNKLYLQSSDTVYLAGDDLISGSQERLKLALNKNLCNTVVIKLGQYATVLDMLQAVVEIKQKKSNIVISQRLGETNDTFIVDFAVGINADFVKFGSPSRGERVAKYNRLIEIESLTNTNIT